MRCHSNVNHSWPVSGRPSSQRWKVPGGLLSGLLSLPRREALLDPWSSLPARLKLTVRRPFVAALQCGHASRARRAMQQTNPPSQVPCEPHGSGSPRACSSRVLPGRARKRVQRSFLYVHLSSPFLGAEVRRLPDVPSRVRSQLPAWSNALHACLPGCGAFPRAQTLRLAYSRTYPPAHPGEHDRWFLSLA